jgi:transposase
MRYTKEMLTLNCCYRLFYRNFAQQNCFVEWMETYPSTCNYVLREFEDWCNGRKCQVDPCLSKQEYILSADLKFPNQVQQLNALPHAHKEFPRWSEVPSQVWQQTIQKLHRSWESFQKRGYGLPRFKKYARFKCLLFPQFKGSPIVANSFNLPKHGLIPINLYRPIPDGFTVKQALCDVANTIFIIKDRDHCSFANGMLGKHMVDAGFAKFRSISGYFGVVKKKGMTSQEYPEFSATTEKKLSVRVHKCHERGFTVDREVAAGLNISNRGIQLISTVGQTGMETACADVLPGIGATQSRQVSKPRKGTTRKSQK